MKIALINVVASIQSTGRNILELSKEFSKCGHECLVLYSYGKEIEMNNVSYFRFGSKLDRKIHSLLSRVTGLNGYYSTGATNDLIKKLDDFHPDIVHVNNIHGSNINFNILMNHLKNKYPTCITLHDCWMFTGKCTHFISADCNKWKKGCSNCPQLKKDIPSFYFDQTDKMYSDKKDIYQDFSKLGIIGVSNWITNLAKESILQNALFETIYNWIDLSKFNNTCDRKIKNEFIILGVCTKWSDHKGLYDFIELSSYLKEDEKIMLVGDMDNSIRLPKNIIHIKNTANVEELVKIYQNADVFVNPSYYETFGKVNAEALACGLPLVVYDNTALKEFITNDTGYVVNNKTVSELYEAICKVRSSNVDYKTKCFEYAANNFKLEIQAKMHLNFYDKIINRRDDLDE